MKVITYSGSLNSVALQLAGVLVFTAACGLIFLWIGSRFGRHIGATLGGIGVMVGLFLAFKIFY